MLCADKDITIVHIDAPGELSVSHASGCSWRKIERQSTAGTTVKANTSNSVRIPLIQAVRPQKGDIIIQGNVEVSTASTIAQILEKNPGSFIAQSVAVNDYGSEYIRHIHIEG